VAVRSRANVAVLAQLRVMVIDRPGRRETALRHLPQFSWASRVTAGAAGFLTFIQQPVQPAWYGEPRRFDTMPSQPSTPKGGRKPIIAKCETVRTLPSFREAYRKRRCILPVERLLRMEGDQRPEGEAATSART
jgi:putative SOS response-associated peptidase YedK